jgi:hypothetical protein
MPKGSQALLLDLYPNASAAYSLRKLRTAYSGSAIRVRRTDLTEQNIGFNSSGELDTVALLAFVGTGALNNGFVTTWYDQSGNGRNATQITAGKQSRIVLNGVVELLGSKPCLNTFAANVLRDYQISYSNLLPLPISIISSHKIDTLPTNAFNNVTFNIGGTVNAGGGSRYERATDNTNIHTSVRRTTSSTNFVSQSLSALASVIHCSFFKTTDLQQRLNGVDSATVAYSGTPFATASNWNILNANSLNLTFHGSKRFYEIIIFETDQFSNRTGIESNINSYYNVY